MAIEGVPPNRKPSKARAPEALRGPQEIPFKVEKQPQHLRDLIPKMLEEVIASFDSDRTQIIDLAPLVEQAGSTLKTDPQIVSQLRQLRALIQQWRHDASRGNAQYWSFKNMERALAISESERTLLEMIDLIAGPELQSKQRVSETAPTEFIRRPKQIRPVLRPRELTASPAQPNLVKPAAETSLLDMRKKIEEAPQRIDQVLTQIEEALEGNELLRIPDLVQILVGYEKYIDDVFIKPRIQEIVKQFTSRMANETFEPKTQQVFESLRYLDQLAGRPETALAKPQSAFERSLEWLKKLFQ